MIPFTLAAATIAVNTTAESPGGAGECTLAEAIMAANSDAAVGDCTAGSGADVITVPAGTYTLTTALPQIDSTVTIQGTGLPMIIRSAAAPAFRIIDASGGSADTTLDGLEIVNGLAVGADGGGVYTRARPLTVNGSRLRDNSTNGSGGGISTGGFLGTTAISDTILENNSATSDGGGLYILGDLTIDDSTIRSNTSSVGGGLRHGGGTAVIDSTVISGNTSTGRGGGIAASFVGAASIMTITGSVIEGNTSVQEGGGAALQIATITDTRIDGNISAYTGGGLQFHDDSTITGSTISRNSAVFGGGIANRGNSDAVVTLINSTVSANDATNDGGGLYVDIGGTFDLQNATVTNNIADSDADGSGDGGGIFRGSAVGVFLGNTILAGNHDGLEIAVTKSDSQDPATEGIPFDYTIEVTKAGSNPDCSGDMTSNGNNLIGNTDGCTVILLGSDIAGTGAAPIDPRLGPLQDNGGPTETHALESGSPAIDNGSGCPALDQRGVARPVGAQCDIGAYEGSVAASAAGPSTGFTVTDNLPAGLTFQGASAPQGTCTGTTTIVCNLGPIANGATIPITITVVPDSVGVVTNTATASGSGVPGVATSTSADEETVILGAPAGADVSITKTASPPDPIAGANITYTIVVSNAGPDAATSVSVSDPVPAGTNLVSSDSTQGTCSGTTTVTCDVGALAGGGSATITIVVATTAAGPVVNTATVTAAETDPNGTNNSAQTTTPVGAATAIPSLGMLGLIALALCLAIAQLMMRSGS